MEKRKAIEILQENYPKTAKNVNGTLQGGFDDKDCELGQAMTIGINAIRSQIALYPMRLNVADYICPVCLNEIPTIDEYLPHEYCPCCGQRIRRDGEPEE